MIHFYISYIPDQCGEKTISNQQSPKAIYRKALSPISSDLRVGHAAPDRAQYVRLAMSAITIRSWRSGRSPDTESQYGGIYVFRSAERIGGQLLNPERQKKTQPSQYGLNIGSLLQIFSL